MYRDYSDTDPSDRPVSTAEHAKGGDPCDNEAPSNGYRCTRDPGHDGAHEADGGDGRLIGVWQTDERPALNLAEVLIWHGHDPATVTHVAIEFDHAHRAALVVTHRLRTRVTPITDL